MTLYEKTVHLLKNLSRSVTYADIEKETGISREWISALARGKIKNPGVKNVQKLYEFLSDEKLVF